MGLTQNLGLLSTAIKATSTLNVGIGGDADASAKLKVSGDLLLGLGSADVTLTIPTNNTGSGYAGRILGKNSTGQLIIQHRDNSATFVNAITISSGGGVPQLTFSGPSTFSSSISGGAVYAASGYVNETQTITTPALVYSFNKDQGSAGGSSNTTFNITGLPNVNGSFAFIHLRSSNTASGVNIGMTLQIHGYTIFSVSTQNVTKTASFMIYKQNGTWVATAVGTGGTAGYP